MRLFSAGLNSDLLLGKELVLLIFLVSSPVGWSFLATSDLTVARAGVEGLFALKAKPSFPDSAGAFVDLVKVGFWGPYFDSSLGLDATLRVKVKDYDWDNPLGFSNEGAFFIIISRFINPPLSSYL